MDIENRGIDIEKRGLDKRGMEKKGIEKDNEKRK
jgi:hypothetical protein